MEAASDKKAARSSQKGLAGLLRSAENCLNLLIHELSKEVEATAPENERYAILLLQGVGSSVHSIRLLLDKSYMGARDALSISRSICESAVNCCYLLVEGEELGRKATRYSEQRFYRDSVRSAEVAGLRISVSPQVPLNVEDIPTLADSLREFTRPSGAEVRDWCGVPIDKRIERIAQVNKESARALAASRLLIYGISSEILHGSPFGVIYFWTAFNRQVLRETARRQLMGHYITAIGTSLLAVEGITATLIELGKVQPHVAETLPSLKALEKLLLLNFEDPIEPECPAKPNA